MKYHFGNQALHLLVLVECTYGLQTGCLGAGFSDGLGVEVRIWAVGLASDGHSQKVSQFCKKLLHAGLSCPYFLLVRHLLLLAMHLFLIASCYY